MEDAKLLEAMLDVINSGSQFKADNGFKPGFFHAVEQHLAVSLPNSGIKAKPYIKSRIKTLKSDWSSMHDMLAWNSTSGFGWDYENNILEAPQPVFGRHMFRYIKMLGNGEAKNFLIIGTFASYLVRIEQMEDAQTAANIISEMGEDQVEHGDDTQDIGDGLEDLNVDTQLNTPGSTPCEEGSSTQRKRKRSSWDPLFSNLKDVADIIGNKIEEATKNFTAVLGIERDREELHKSLNAVIKKVVGLTIRKCNKVVHVLSRDEDLMVVFFTVDDEDKVRMDKGFT